MYCTYVYIRPPPGSVAPGMPVYRSYTTMFLAGRIFSGLVRRTGCFRSSLFRCASVLSDASDYERLRNDFNLEVPRYFNFCRVLDRWAAVEKVGSTSCRPSSSSVVSMQQMRDVAILIWLPARQLEEKTRPSGGWMTMGTNWNGRLENWSIIRWGDDLIGVVERIV